MDLPLRPWPKHAINFERKNWWKFWKWKSTKDHKFMSSEYSSKRILNRKIFFKKEIVSIYWYFIRSRVFSSNQFVYERKGQCTIVEKKALILVSSVHLVFQFRSYFFNVKFLVFVCYQFSFNASFYLPNEFWVHRWITSWDSHVTFCIRFSFHSSLVHLLVKKCRVNAQWIHTDWFHTVLLHTNVKSMLQKSLMWKWTMNPVLSRVFLLFSLRLFRSI